MDIAPIEYNEQQDNTNQNSNQLSFLGLPKEIRLLIYEYLIPDNEVGFMDRPGRNPMRPHRRDEQRCYPAFLRTNQQVYHEGIEIWYSKALFCLRIWQEKLNFMGRTFSVRGSILHPKFHLIRNLNIYVPCEHPKSDIIEKLVPWTQSIINSLSGRPYKLSRISIGLSFCVRHAKEYITWYVNDSGRKFTRILEWMIQPLRLLRGVEFHLSKKSEESWESTMWRHRLITRTHNYPEHVELEAYSKFVSIRAQLFARLAAEMQ